MTDGSTYARVPTLVFAERLQRAWEWRTSGGELMHAAPGDYRVTDPSSGRQWSITSAALGSGYRDLGDGRFESRGVVTATRVAENSAPVAVMSSEGPEAAKPGDWVLLDDDGHPWVVDDAWFQEHYVKV